MKKKFNISKLRISIKTILSCLVSLLFNFDAFAINGLQYISTEKGNSSIGLYENGRVASILYSDNDYIGVIRAINDLQTDLRKVTGIKPKVSNDISNVHEMETVIIIGTLGKNEIIDRIVEKQEIDVSVVSGKWESFLTQTVNNPVKGIQKALLIIGSDKRGTIYGIYDLCEKIGISPWYWWADVPVMKKKAIYVKAGSYTIGEPKVKYRGIFINDEAPALSGWAHENFGGFNHKFYEHVFELILRLKGNFLWPAMWGSAFNDDDTLNAILADEYGIVMSTSHHEPLMRAHKEWRKYGKGEWNYETNPENLQKFWRDGIERMDKKESIVTVGMRGDGDEAMSDNTAIALLEEIINDQRQIIEETTGKPANKTPQIWAIYKEVQEYYNQGMQVPDDVTLLFCDDNWGNIRILPAVDAKEREGGYGMYYHFDFVGGPRNYKWLNTVQIERVWEQMRLSYCYGVDRVWLVNVGDIKPMEFPISFFLDFAWDPNKWTAKQLPNYYTIWANQQFGNSHAQEIGNLIAKYTKFNSRRKPEMLDATTYSLIDYNEAETVVKEYNQLLNKAKTINTLLPDNLKDAFYQLVLFPIEACANLNNMYYCAALNHLHAKQKRSTANLYAQKVAYHFEKDSLLSLYYHTKVANGKWNHMMSQIRIGYTYWQQPDKATMPKVEIIDVPPYEKLGITMSGTENVWPIEESELVLPVIDAINKQTSYIELFNQGEKQSTYTIETEYKWIKFSSDKGTIDHSTKVIVDVDWDKAPKNNTQGEFFIIGKGVRQKVYLPIKYYNSEGIRGFVENNGIISIEASHYEKANNTSGISFIIVPNLGRTGSSVTTHPVTAQRQNLVEDAAHLEYLTYFQNKGKYSLSIFLSPTLNFIKSEGLHFAISIDNSNPVIINMHDDAKIADWKYPNWWNTAVSNNTIRKQIDLEIPETGQHIIKYWPLDPGVVLQKIVIEKDSPNNNSYLGPPESTFIDIYEDL